MPESVPTPYEGRPSGAAPPLAASGAPVDFPFASRIPQALSGPTSALTGLRIVVTGLGVSGFPAAVHLAERGADVIVVDGDTERDMSEHERILEVFDVDIRRGAAHVTGLPRFADDVLPDLVVTSPGWRPDSPVLAEAAELGVPVIGEVELAWRVRGTNDAPWLVVTGTNGKTTTTGLLASMLHAAGLEVRACGNIGAPLLEAVLDPAAEVLAIELSSFQLHWQFSMSAHAAVVLNVSDDHLDWHGGAAAYAADKARVYENVVRACVYNKADARTLEMVENAEVIAGARAIGFGLDTPGPGEFGVVDEVLVDRAFIPERYSSAAEIGTLADVARASGMEHAAPPAHQVANALAAAALARSIDVPPAAIQAGLRSFEPGHDRIEHIASIDGVEWINDTKATNPHAADASLSAFDPVVWIAGGLAKGAEYDTLVNEHAARLRAVVLIGADPAPLGDTLARLAPSVPVVRIPDGSEDAGSADPESAPRGTAVMDRAVAAAAGLAEAGDTVLLAPAAASMDQFVDYSSRGRCFVSAVRNLRD